MSRLEIGRVRPHRLPRRHGFTLIEIVLAVSISAIVILCARTLLENLSRATQRVLRETRANDQDSNGERLLRSLVGTIDVGVQNETFGGDQLSAHFTSWCESPRGWLERCRITLAVDTSSGPPALSTVLPNGERVILRRAERRLGLRYLVDAHDGGTWFVKWGEGMLAPLAIGVIADSDTMIVRIGERG